MLKRRVQRMETLANRCALGEALRRPPRPLQSIQDVLDLLEEQVAAIGAQPWADTLEKARTIAGLARVAAKVIEVGKIAARLEMLETVLKNRKENNQR
jgi:hypothetical protein